MNRETIKGLVKRFWPFILIVILVIIATWFLKPSKIIVQPGEQVIIHKYDSLKYIQKADSLQKVNQGLKYQLNKATGDLISLRLQQKAEIKTISTLFAPGILKIWNQKTGDSAKMNPDSSIMTRLEPLRVAVRLITMNDQCEAREMSYLKKDSISALFIASQEDLLKVKGDRINKLTTEFYQSQMIQAKLNNDLDKANKKVRRRNIVIGVTTGAAAAGILYGVLK